MNNLVRFLKRFHFVLLFLLLEGIAMALLVQNNRYRAGQINRFYNEIAGSLFGEYNNLTDYFNLRKNNLALSVENARLRAQIAQSYNIYDRELFTVDDTVYRLQYKYIQAKIVNNSVTKRNNYLWINKGKNHGIEPGMMVISPDGVVGVVKVVSNNYSSIMSLLHSDSKISARIKKGNFTGSVQWDGRSFNIAQLIDVPSLFKIEAGDEVITSGQSFFPEGTPIGVIDRIKTKQGDVFHTMDIRLSTNFNTLDHVYVVKNLHKKELDELQQKEIADEQ